MSITRPVLFALAALLFTPSVARALDDDPCVAWVHTFSDAEVDNEHDTVTITSESTCLGFGPSFEDLGFPGKPFLGGAPEWSAKWECRELLGEIRVMTAALREARVQSPSAQAALADAARDAFLEKEAYEVAWGLWRAAVEALETAKRDFAEVYEVSFETERDREGRVVIVRRRGYDTSTVLGRAVINAMQTELRKREAMAAAWAAWSGAGGSASAAQAAQFLVDWYANVLLTYPSAIEQARARAAELGCM